MTDAGGSDDPVLYEEREGVAFITLNRPARKNAFTEQMVRGGGRGGAGGHRLAGGVGGGAARRGRRPVLRLRPGGFRRGGGGGMVIPVRGAVPAVAGGGVGSGGRLPVYE